MGRIITSLSRPVKREYHPVTISIGKGLKGIETGMEER